MRIGIDIRNIGKQRTGDEVVFLNLVKNLAKLDTTNEYVLFTDVTDNTVIQNTVLNLGIENRKNFKVVSLATSNKFAWNAWTLPQYLRKNPVDVYHTQYITPLFVSRKIKVITHIHDVSFAVYPQYIKKSDLFFLRMLIPLSLRRADKIIAVSDFTRTEIIRHYGIAPEKVVRTYNALDGAFQRVTNADLLETVRQKYALPEQFILYLGTMQPRKNLPALVRGFAKLTRRLPNIKLVLAGKRHGHNYDQQIDQALIESGVESTVCFPGYIEETDKAAILSLATAFAFPSVYEGFGVPVLEAFATEIPVTVSDLPVFHEVAGQAALFFDSGVLDQIGEILYTICTDKIVRERLVLEGKSRLKVFSWEQSARELIQIYESV